MSSPSLALFSFFFFFPLPLCLSPPTAGRPAPSEQAYRYRTSPQAMDGGSLVRKLPMQDLIGQERGLPKLILYFFAYYMQIQLLEYR
ncbi:hypothetical protein L873DRAFT_1797539 [Choiromyces venosus 120613-1]|uniref:Secreted protein n=1 Tax=Choiromyces venosus 120613-1 TaxID=1336337 RepID=A0A3N4K5F5_9PEZI|nr:hypothetical protein L873DRAFT_1797539 [Choiromyces venosus 120613-1]